MKALVIVDLQNDFLPGGALEVPEGDMIYDIHSESKLNNMFDPNDSTKSKNFTNNHEFEDLLKQIFKVGKSIYSKPSLDHIKSKLKNDLDFLDESHKWLKNPHIYPGGLEKKLFDEKKSMIIKSRKN